MSALEDLADRPRVKDPWDFHDPDVASFHEAACDLAKHMARNPDEYEGLHLPVADLLNDINEAVAALLCMVMGWNDDRAA